MPIRETVRQTVRQRLLEKLPATAATLNKVERTQLRDMEREGLIRYVDQSGYWVKVEN